MKVAHTTTTIYVIWLIASLYWIHSQCALSHPSPLWHEKCNELNIRTTSHIDKHTNSYILLSHVVNVYRNTTSKPRPLITYWENYRYFTLTFFLATCPLQAPLVHKWNGDMSKAQRRISMDIHNNTKLISLCRMAHSRNLDKTFEGAKDMEISQNKKRTSSFASLTVVEKRKTKSNTPKQTPRLWLGFKALNALNESKGLDMVTHKSVSSLVLGGMSDKEALECQNCVPSYPYVPQEMWPNMDDLGTQNFHFTQVPSDVDVCEGFSMDYHVALFFQIDDMLIPKEKALEKITKRLEEMQIMLGDDISDPIAIMCTHGGKQWSGHAKIHLKNVQ